MFIIHCNQKIKPFEIWFLFDNKDFYNRSLSLCKCPSCGKSVAVLSERRKCDDKIFTQYATGETKVQQLMRICSNNLNYSSAELVTKKYKITKPKTLRYGENKIVRVGKKEFQRMNAVSQYGHRERIKDIPISNDTHKQYEADEM